MRLCHKLLIHACVHAGTPEEMQAEVSRLEAILAKLKSTPDTVKRNAGEDYTWDLLKELENRRIASIQYELNRIQAILGGGKEL